MARRPAPAGQYRHEAMLWRGEDEFLAGSVPFIRDGLEASEPVMVATTERRIDLLEDALGPAASRVRFIDMGILGSNPARIIPAWVDFVHDAGGPCRGIGEPIWAGRSAAEISECQLHESLLNVAVPEDTPLWLRCPYEADRLPEQVIEEACRSHPELVAADGEPAESPVYAGPEHAQQAFEAPLPQPASVDVRTRFGMEQLQAVRAEVIRHATLYGIGQDRTDDLALAAYELAANSVRHGGGDGELRLWREPGAIVLEVADAGEVEDLLIGRREVSSAGGSGRGLWMVNHLCDLVQLRSSGRGTTVRVHTWT